MSIIKEIYIEAKRSRNFQTATVGMNIQIEEKDDIDKIIPEYQAACKIHAEEALTQAENDIKNKDKIQSMQKVKALFNE